MICSVQVVQSQNSPLTTAGTIVAPGTTAVVPVTASNFTNITSFELELHYNPSIANATSVAIGPGMGGVLNSNLTVPGIVHIGWFAYPAVTLSGTPVILNITFSKVASGTTSLAWYDEGDGSLCYYINGSGIILNDIPASSFYFNGSLTFGVPLSADFSASNLTPPKNTTVLFSDLTTGSPTGWAWSFNRPSVTFVNGTTAASQNPQVQFTDGGLYTVTLVASNGSGSNTKVKTDYIRAGIAGLWAGVSSTEWATTTNWDNWLVPVSSTDVVIPSSATFWPVYTGDLTLGTTCKSITMNGSSLATVSGNFAINPGAYLDIVNNGIFKVGGNWTNAGSFSAGAGTIEFIGVSPASIFSGGAPPVMNTFYNLTISKPGVNLTILPDITVNGDVTINP